MGNTSKNRPNIFSYIVPALYGALSYMIIGVTAGSLIGQPDQMLFAEPAARWIDSSYKIFVLGWLPLIAAIVILLSNILFKREAARTSGMILTASVLVGIGFWSAYHWNNRALLDVAWPGMLSVTLMWIWNIDTAYEKTRVWKWEIFFAFILFLATVAFIPYALSLKTARDPSDFRITLATVTTHGIGLLLCLLVFLNRLSPRNSESSLMQILSLCIRVITSIFKSHSASGDIPMAIASVNNTLSDLLADIMSGNKRTIMYTDIRSSTEMIERLGNIDAYWLFQKSWDFSCKELQKWKCTTPKDLGDGLLTTFDSASDAVKAGIAILNAHKQYNSTAEPDRQIFLKIGLHTGNILLHHGWDPRGRDSHLAQRVVSAAQPESILMTKSTLDEIELSGEKLEGKWSKEVALKGILNRIDLFEITPM